MRAVAGLMDFTELKTTYDQIHLPAANTPPHEKQRLS
jgi:hypothetical protein